MSKGSKITTYNTLKEALKDYAGVEWGITITDIDGKIMIRQF